jgi:hypothetical protein
MVVPAASFHRVVKRNLLVEKRNRRYHPGMLENLEPVAPDVVEGLAQRRATELALLAFLALASVVSLLLPLGFAVLPPFSIPACIFGIEISWHNGSGHNSAR